jgi:hypothetical protein
MRLDVDSDMELVLDLVVPAFTFGLVVGWLSLMLLVGWMFQGRRR